MADMRDVSFKLMESLRRALAWREFTTEDVERMMKSEEVLKGLRGVLDGTLLFAPAGYRIDSVSAPVEISSCKKTWDSGLDGGIWTKDTVRAYPAKAFMSDDPSERRTIASCAAVQRSDHWDHAGTATMQFYLNHPWLIPAEWHSKVVVFMGSRYAPWRPGEPEQVPFMRIRSVDDYGFVTWQCDLLELDDDIGENMLFAFL